MPAIIFDIETVGNDFETLDEISQESFLRFADTQEKIQEAKDSLNFYPHTAQVVAIGMLESDSEKGVVYFQNNTLFKEKFTEGDITYISGTETEILGHFWNQISKYPQFVTFNGRIFDCPFMMLRSAMMGVRPTKNLVPYRYDYKMHIDLADQLTFYDALRKKFSLHMWCNAFNIESPKEEGVSGADVKPMFLAGRYHDIARYCMRDIISTKKLYQYWDKYLRF